MKYSGPWMKYSGKSPQRVKLFKMPIFVIKTEGGPNSVDFAYKGVQN